MKRLWLVSAALAVSAICCAVIGAEAKRLKDAETETITPYEAAARGNLPTCCPKSPTLYCDFIFDGYEHSLPTFHLNDGFYGDHPLSPTLAKTLGWTGWLGRFSPGVKDTNTGQLVTVASTYKEPKFLQCPEVLPTWIGPGDQFYLGGTSDSPVAKLYTRAFQKATPHQHGRHFYEGRCVLMQLTSVSIPSSKGSINIESGDGNEEYPEDRRCIVFKTSK